MPSFQEHREMLALWAELPGVERVQDGVALTFDDGPDPDATPEVLDALDAAQIKATFFLVGEQVEAHPGLAQEIVSRRHEVQAHCYDHTALGQVEDPAMDLWRTIEAIFKATGVAPTMQRPPYGRFTPVAHSACMEAGLQPIYWSAWGEDWEDIGADRIADFVVRDLSDGVVILLHDSARYAHRPSARATAAAIPLIAAAMADAHLSPRPISPAPG
jgi:peptidoglycan/xylan/chitin deacetylase (PgdA/CDA1 family)